MRYLLIFTLSAMMVSCGSDSGSDINYTMDNGQEFVSVQEGGKWTTDLSTAQELKGLKNTLDNFNQLNKKKYENLKAYQEFGELMEMHVDRVNNYCRLDENSKNRLCSNLNRIKEQVVILKGDDMEKSRQALEAVNKIFSEVDATFNYQN